MQMAAGQIRVLVADDNPDHRFFIERALVGMAGIEFEVATVTDGAEALDYLFRRNGFEGAPRPQLILLDLRMPKVDGHGVLEELKSDPALRRIPVAVLSSSERPDDVGLAYDLGTNCYLVKADSASAIRDVLVRVTEYWTDVSRLPPPLD